MSKSSDRSLEESMGRRRPKEVIQKQVAESIIAEMASNGTVDIAITNLYSSPFQVRTMGSSEEIERLAESIQRSGLISPIIVRPVIDPKPELRIRPPVNEEENLQVKLFEVITGHHRVLACLRLGWESVPVLIRPMRDADAAIALTADNAVKKDLTDWDRYQHIKMLEETGACHTGREVAAALGISPSQVTNLRAFDRLPDAARQIIRENPGLLSYKYAYGLCNYKPNGHTQSIDLCVEAPAVVANALSLLATGKIKDQSALAPWVASQLRKPSPKRFRREVKIQRPTGLSVSIAVTDSEAVIRAPGINLEKLQRLIEENITDLM